WTDGKGRLRIELVAVSGSFIPFEKVGEMMGQQVKKIGIQLDVLIQERSLAFKRRDGNELQTILWANDGSELLYAFPVHAIPVQFDSVIGPLIGQWYASGGEKGLK